MRILSVEPVSSGAHAGVYAGHTERRVGKVYLCGAAAAWLIREECPDGAILHFVAPYQPGNAGIDAPAWRTLRQAYPDRERLSETIAEMLAAR